MPPRDADELVELLLDLELDLDTYGSVSSTTLARLHRFIGVAVAAVEPSSAAARHAAEAGHRLGRGCCAAA